MAHAAVGKRRQRGCQLDRRDHPVTLADAGDHGFARIERLFQLRPLPGARRQHAGRFAGQVDAGGTAETEIRHPRAEAVDAHVQRERIEIRVDRARDGLAQIDQALAAAHVVAIAARLAGDEELAGRQHRVLRPAQAEFESAEAEIRLDRGARRETAGDRAVEQGLVRIVHQRGVVGAADAVDEQVRIEARRAGQREHFAIARIDRGHRAGASGQRIEGHPLQARVDAQVQVLARRRRDAVDRLADHALVDVHLDLLVARQAVQLALVLALDAGLADLRGAGVFVGIEVGSVRRVDAADIADHVREIRAARIGARQIRHHVDAGEAPALRGETRDLVLGQFQAQRNAVERTLAFAQRGETLDVVVRQRDHLGERGEHRVHVLDLLGHHFEAERGDVLGQQHAVAVVDQAARRRNAAHRDAVVVRTRREFGVAGDLQVPETRGESGQAQRDQDETGERATAETLRFALRVLDLPGRGFSALFHDSRTRRRARASSSSRNTHGHASAPTSGASQ